MADGELMNVNVTVLRNGEMKRMLTASAIWFAMILTAILFIESKMVMIAMLFVLFAGWMLLVCRAFSLVYEGVRQVSQGADQLMRGEYGIRFKDDDEGDLSILSHQFNQLSVRLQLSMEELNQEQERLKRLISDVSHQFKTPLSSLVLFQELLSDPSASEHERTMLLERNRNELFRMERLIQSLLTMSRLEAGVIEVRPVTADLASTVKECMGSLESIFRQNQLSICLKWGNAPLPLAHDTFWLSEAIRNILHNAIDFTPEYGEITIELQRTEMTLQMTIRDSGIGIDQEDLPYIFQRFYQGKQGRLNGRRGTGVGLALSQLIIEKHGGHIRAESSLGQGTSVVMVFPVSFQSYDSVREGCTES